MCSKSECHSTAVVNRTERKRSNKSEKTETEKETHTETEKEADRQREREFQNPLFPFQKMHFEFGIQYSVIMYILEDFPIHFIPYIFKNIEQKSTSENLGK